MKEFSGLCFCRIRIRPQVNSKSLGLQMKMPALETGVLRNYFFYKWHPLEFYRKEKRAERRLQEPMWEHCFSYAQQTCPLRCQQTESTKSQQQWQHVVQICPSICFCIKSFTGTYMHPLVYILCVLLQRAQFFTLQPTKAKIVTICPFPEILHGLT